MFGTDPLSARRKLWAIIGSSSLLVALSGVWVAAHAGGSAMSAPAGVGAQAADCPSGFAASAPIVINTDADWKSANVRGLTGSGTATSPYVISCLSITGA